MPLTLDYSADWQYWDLTEEVTFTSIANAHNSPLTVEKALQAQPTAKERAPTGGVYVGADLQWFLPGALLSGLVVKPGDTITPLGGPVYTVLSREYDQLDQVYQCYTVALSIAHSLADSLTVWAPTNNQDAAGSRVPTFAQVGTALDARFQLTKEEQSTQRGKQVWQRTYRAYVAAEVTITNEYQVRDGNGNVYQVEDYENRQRIDELSVITCVRYGDS